jgi:glucose/arabinose dehydrogenase
MRRTPLIPLAAAALSLVATAFAPAANAADPDTLADGLVSPLTLAVATDGTVYVTENNKSVLDKIAPGGEASPIYADEAQREVGGVSVSGDVVTFTTTGFHDSRVYTLTPNGDGYDQAEIANTWAYEKAHNPDGNRTYGISGLSRSCKHRIPKEVRGFVVRYHGIKDSHPYATAVVGATTYVADAAGNAILAVDATGVSTVAVLPAVKVTVNKKLRKGLGLPKCTQGRTFKGEPVPTDVEVGPDGKLYVTTLGGGLGESLPVGAVYQVDPATGAVASQGSGLFGPVGLAISPTGTAYISQLFAGNVLAKPLGGDPSVFTEVSGGPGGVELNGTDLYVTDTDLFGNPDDPHGKVLKFSTVG